MNDIFMGPVRFCQLATWLRRQHIFDSAKFDLHRQSFHYCYNAIHTCNKYSV